MGTQLTGQPADHTTTTSVRGRRPFALWLLMALLLLQSIAAIPAGFLLAADPTGSALQMPVAWLQYSPFADYRIPGLFLCLVLGVGPLLTLIGLIFLPEWGWLERINPFHRQHWTWTAAVLVGVLLMAWIVIQVLMVRMFVWLQPFFFGVGLGMVLLAVTPAVRRYLRSS